MTRRVDESMIDQLAIANLRLLANISGGPAVPIAQTLDAVLDAILGDTRGALITRGTTGWITLNPGADGTFLQSRGAGADLAFAAIPGGGDVLASNNGSEWAAAAAQFAGNLGLIRRVRIQEFMASSTYTPSDGMLSWIAECWGGGGGGGSALGASGNVVSAGGGGAGSKSIKYGSASDIGASKPVTIGGGGTGGVGGAANDGSPGGDTSVGGLCIGKGGAGGIRANVLSVIPAGGAGGIAGTGDITGVGAPGGAGILYGSTNSYFPSGAGGSTELGAGGKAVTAISTNYVVGSAGSGFGAGGSGGSVNNLLAGPSGGNGAPGFVRITEFCTQ